MSEPKVRPSSQQKRIESSHQHKPQPKPGMRPPMPRKRATSRDILNSKLAEMGSYTKYLSGIR